MVQSKEAGSAAEWSDGQSQSGNVFKVRLKLRSVYFWVTVIKGIKKGAAGPVSCENGLSPVRSRRRREMGPAWKAS